MKQMKSTSWNIVTWVAISLIFLLMVLVMIWYSGWPLAKYAPINICWGKFVSQIGELKAGTVYMGEYNAVDVDFGKEGTGCALRVWFVNKEGFIQDMLPAIEKIEAKIAAPKSEGGYEREVDIESKILKNCDVEYEENKGFIIASPWFGESPDVGGAVTWILIGGAVGGFFGPGKTTGVLSKFGKKGVSALLLLDSAEAIIGGYYGGKAHDAVKRFIEHMEEWGKSAACYPMRREFKDELVVPKFGKEETVPEPDTDEEGKESQLLSPGGKYCIVLFKGREKYYVDYLEGKCKDNTESIKSLVERFKEEDRGQAG